MERAHFFDGQQIGASDLNSITTTLSSEMKNRTIDFFSKGVIGSNTDIFVLPDLGNTVKIKPFVAYTPSGERIYVYKEIRALALDLSTPTERRLRQQGSLPVEDFGWEVNTTYDIYVAYIEKPGKPKAQTTTGKFYPTRVYSGFEFYALRPGIDTIETQAGVSPLVRLCRIITTAGEEGSNTYSLSILTSGYIEFSSLDASKVYTKANAETPANYNPLNPVSMQDHIMCLGSGTPTPQNPHGYTPSDLGFDAVSVQTHETRLHTSGILGNRNSLTSALYIELNSITTIRDNLKLYNLASDEQLHYNGLWLDSLSYGENLVFLQFQDSVGLLPNGTYTIGISPVSGDLIVSSGTTDAVGRSIIITRDSSGANVLGSVQVISTAAYNTETVFPLARFSFTNTKQTSTITPGITESNFTSKTDLRTFGSVSALELQTSKELDNTDIIELPYTVKVDKLVLGDGTEISTKATNPAGYISGLLMKYNTTTSVTISAGVARDSSNSVDITLASPITKNINTKWSLGGLSTPVGGLVNTTDPNTIQFNTDGGYTLHVFVMGTVDGITDVAFDTSVTANNIRANGLTSSFVYLRRIGSLYVSPYYTQTGLYLIPFNCVEMPSGYILYYTNKQELKTNDYNYGLKSFTNTYVPDSATFIGKFNYQNTVEGSVSTNIVSSGIAINSSGVLDLPLSNARLNTATTWTFNTQKIYCMGYYDGRNA